jgi:hypothetical protein
MFMAFSFARGKRWFSLPRVCAGYFPRVGWSRLGWGMGREELCMVRDAHLYLLQFQGDSFGASCWVETTLLFLVWCGIGRLSMG